MKQMLTNVGAIGTLGSAAIQLQKLASPMHPSITIDFHESSNGATPVQG